MNSPRTPPGPTHAHAICARWDATDLLPRLRQLEKQLQDAAAFAGLPFDREVGELKNSKNYQGLVNVFFWGGNFEHHLLISVGDCIPDSWVMFDWDI